MNRAHQPDEVMEISGIGAPSPCEEYLMKQVRSRWMQIAVAVALVAAVAGPADATTLLRQSLEELTANNRAIVVGEVVDAQSYWNEEGNFILTDVTVRTADVVKGEVGGEVKVTVLGGTVGEITTLILGGPELVPGRSYVLFLAEDDLPGARGALTVRDQSQGVFDVVVDKGHVRAVSQANGQPLVPDARGYVDAPGGLRGFLLDDMIEGIRESVDEAPAARLEIQ